MGRSGAWADVNREENRQLDAGYYIEQSNARTVTAPTVSAKTTIAQVTNAASAAIFLAFKLISCDLASRSK